MVGIYKRWKYPILFANQFNQSTGLGTGHGHWEIRDSLTSNLNLTGSFEGVVVDGSRLKGLAIAKLTGGGRIVANLSVIVTPLGALGNIGSPLTGVESDPTVIQVGSCSEGFGP